MITPAPISVIQNLAFDWLTISPICFSSSMVMLSLMVIVLGMGIGGLNGF